MVVQHWPTKSAVVLRTNKRIESLSFCFGASPAQFFRLFQHLPESTKNRTQRSKKSSAIHQRNATFHYGLSGTEFLCIPTSTTVMSHLHQAPSYCHKKILTGPLINNLLVLQHQQHLVHFLSALFHSLQVQILPKPPLVDLFDRFPQKQHARLTCDIPRQKIKQKGNG